jgi:hypothetical protein
LPSPPEFGPEVMSVYRMTGPETFGVAPFAFGTKPGKVRAIARHEKYLKEAINGVFMVFGPGSWNDERCGLKKYGSIHDE